MGRTKGALNKKTLAKLHAQGGVLPVLGEQSAFQLVKQEMQGPSPAESSPSEPAAGVEAKSPSIFIEYFAPNGEKWRVEQGTALLEMFSLSGDSVATWHGALAPEERVWRILRWRFGIAPMLAGPTDGDYLVPLPIEHIAERLAIDVKAVESEIDSAKAFWVRWQMAHKSDIPAIPPAEIPRATPTEEEALLKLHAFSDLTDEDERTYVFGRISDLKHKLEDEEGRTIAQRCIRVELRIRRNDAIMAKLEREAADPKTDADKASSLRGDINGYHSIGGDLSKEHLDLMKAMNATQEQNPSVQRKVAFRDCLGQITRAMQEYESRGDTTLIDGMFAAAEVKILTTPMSLRRPQYRVDIVMLTRDAMKHENLWNPEYEPPAIERGMYRRMRGALDTVLAAAENETGAVIEMEDDENAFGASGDEVVSEVPVPAITAQDNGATAPPGVPALAGRGTRGRPGDDFTTS